MGNISWTGSVVKHNFALVVEQGCLELPFVYKMDAVVGWTGQTYSSLCCHINVLLFFRATKLEDRWMSVDDLVDIDRLMYDD